MKEITKFLNEAWHTTVYPSTLHFETPAAAFLYQYELSGQISDGKYENSRPYDHWKWVSKVSCVIDGKKGYEGMPHRLKYNLREWPGYIKKASNGDSSWTWAYRVLDFGRLAKSLTKDEAQKCIDGTIKHADTIAEAWGGALRKNPDAEYKDINEQVADYLKKYIADCSIADEAHFKKFKGIVYTEAELKEDLRSMTDSVNNIL